MSRLFKTNQLADMLKKEEGFRSHVYSDHLGYKTIGYGRCIEEGIGLGLTEDEATYLLMQDIQRSVAECENFDWFMDLDEPRAMVVVALAFQMGWPRLNQFGKMLAAFAGEDYEPAADELLDSKFARQVPARAERLSEIVRTGEWDD